MPAIMQLENVTKKFGGLTAVDHLSMKIEEKSIHALIGPNGSGKTTSLNMIAGVLKATEGAISFNNEVISALPTFKIAQKGIGRTFQNIKLYSSMTVLENVMVGGHSKGNLGFQSFLLNIPAARKEERFLREKAEELLFFLGMYHLKDELVKNLPYGRQKVLEIGRTLMGDPSLILLDEPAAGLNPSERLEVVSILVKLYKQGKTLLLIEHNMDVVMSISHKVTVLNFGAKIAEGSPMEIQNNEEVIKAYLGSKRK
ncbi:ABC transporter ATP-binding protein [Petroclostridium sp. X23]|uniref:ABC transporter ATP-binding protein n=1 Tax=Petroclostridium sp. X23 TaxID=3045146 RepID=UPI0032C10F2F